MKNISTTRKFISLGVVALVAVVYIAGSNQELNDARKIVAKEAGEKLKISPMVQVSAGTHITQDAEVTLAKNDTCKLRKKRFDCNEKQVATTVNDKIFVDGNNGAWSVGNVKAPIPSIRLNEKIVAYEVVEIDQHPENTPQVGEKITLPMLKGQKVVVDVKSISTNANGDKSWSGHLEGQGTDYPVIMTYGEHSIFAMITTPEGSYSMESIDGVGWLYKNPSEFELSSAGKNDFLEVHEIL